MSHYKGVYRLKTEWDKNTKMFPREYTGLFAENDVYIDCYNDCRIFHYGGRILEYYCPSLQRGRNIVKAIREYEKHGTIYSVNDGDDAQHIDENEPILPIKSHFQGENIIHNIIESDSEVMFRFNAKDMERLEPFLKPKTSGASISPFSSRNLPKNKDYKIPDEESLQYKAIVEKIGQKRIIELTHATNSFLQSLITKRNTWENIKADMALKGLSGKNYIHSIGKWDDYISYLERSIEWNS